MKQIKKLQLKKEVVAKLTKSEMNSVRGGAELTVSPWCGADAVPYAQITNYPVSQIPYQQSFPNDPRNNSCNGGYMCGSVPGYIPTCG